MLSINIYIVPHIIQVYEYTHRCTNICSEQSCMSQCQQCLLSCNVLYISFQLCYCETKNKTNKYRPYADKNSSSWIYHYTPPQHFHKNLSGVSEQQMLSRFRVIAKIHRAQGYIFVGPLFLRIQWTDYITLLFSTSDDEILHIKQQNACNFIYRKVGLLLTVLRWKPFIPSPRIQLSNALSLSEHWQPARETRPTSESKRELNKWWRENQETWMWWFSWGWYQVVVLLMTLDEHWTKNCG